MHEQTANLNVNYIADCAKYHYAAGVTEIAALQRRLAVLAAEGKLDPEESRKLQGQALNVWYALYFGTVLAVRAPGRESAGFHDVSDYTFSDGRPVLAVSRIEPVEASDMEEQCGGFLFNIGAVTERPPGVAFTINPIAVPARKQ